MRFSPVNRLIGFTAGMCALFGMVSVCPAEPAEQNIALGRPYVMQDAPNYPYCTDAGDATQLTDGQYGNTTDVLWIQQGTVGWRSIIPVMVTIDLGSVQPISGASYSTAADASVGSEWPSAIFILVSDDQKVWHEAGDLVVHSLQAGRTPIPAKTKGSIFRFRSTDLKTRGRYVRFVVVPKGVFTFCDEMEVYRGPDSLLNQPVGGRVIADPTLLARVAATNTGIRNRLNADLTAVRARLSVAHIDADKKAALSARLDAAGKKILDLPDANPDTFRTIFPMNGVQGEILAINGALLRDSGLPTLSAGKVGRYDAFSPLKAPRQSADQAAVSIEMMGNEVRADAFLLTNATEQPIQAKIRLVSLPGGPCPQWLKLSVVPWTDTSDGMPIAAALPITQGVNEAYPITLPAGLTSKIWLSVDSSKLEAGEHNGQLLVESESGTLSLPFTLKVSAIRMGVPRLSLGMWDYSNDGEHGRYGRNTTAAIKMLRSNFVDTAWSTREVLPWPQAEDFDASGNLIKPLQTEGLDRWVAQWPGARRYAVFANVPTYENPRNSFAGTAEGSPEFNARVASWAKALGEHMISLKLKPEQLALCLVDEPANSEQDQRVIVWARAIRAATPRPIIFEDPDTVPSPANAERFKSESEYISLSDIVCPQFMPYHTGGTEAAEYYEKFRQAGHSLWFYQCMGPVKTFSPQIYYRELAWHAFARNFVGIGFWSFFDKGNMISCWNEYDTSRTPFVPTFLDPRGITSGLHWEAIREGVEDYEYLAMLKDAAGQTGDTKLQSEAMALLRSADTALIRATPANNNWSENYAWKDDAPGGFKPDAYRIQVLHLLEKLKAN